MSDPRIARRILELPFEEELARSYARYAKYTILDRALPDVRDGLKPVQRRIIYAMYDSGNRPDKAYRKCAKTVGDVMGNYHPHGDQSIYGALVRLAQPWKMRELLVDGHGNFGSDDDDPPAAMRYTESRLAPLAMELVRDIDKETVAFQPTFDDKALEPVVLPARYPNLLVNGSTGLSTGFATEIPPHNLKEVINGVVALIEDPNLPLQQLMQHIPGPDFPTGGILLGRKGLEEAYETGSGRVQIRARVETESARRVQRFVAPELPYGVIKSNLVRDLDQLRLDDKVNGLVDVRDESDREGTRLVIELAKDANAEAVMAYLYKKTDLQKSYNFNMVAICERTPCQLGLREILLSYLDHQKEVVRRRTAYDLAQASERLHLVEGFVKAFDILDDIIAVIRLSQDKADAKERLLSRFELSPAQAEAILQLRLHRLTNLQILELRQEAEELKARIDGLRTTLENEWRIMGVVREELLALQKAFAQPRRTRIEDEVPTLEVTLEVTIDERELFLQVTRGGFLRVEEKPPDTDRLVELASGELYQPPRLWTPALTTQYALFLSNHGQCYTLPVHTLPTSKKRGPGTGLINLMPLQPDEEIVSIVPIPGDEAVLAGRFLTFATREGQVKRTPLGEFLTNRTTGIAAMGLSKGDQVLAAFEAPEGGDLMLVTRTGYAIRFALEEVSDQGRQAKGVKGIDLRKRDEVIAAIPLAADEDEGQPRLWIFTPGGRGKRSCLEEYRSQGRGGRGILTLKQRKRPVDLQGACLLDPTSEQGLFLVTTADRLLSVTSIPRTARDGSVYKLVDLERQEKVAYQVTLFGGPELAEDGAAEAGDVGQAALF